ncbi:MAG: OmpA family protein [Pseudomonadota bacterium]
MPRAIIAGLFVMLATASTDAQQSNYSAEDIVEHFRNQAGSSGTAQQTRGVVIGAAGFGNSTQSSAGTAATEAPPDPGAYNLMVTFELNSDRLTPIARSNLDEFAKALRAPDLASLRFAVDGHTDSSGSDTYNFGLSARRADAVVRYLTRNGIDGSRLEARGFGETRPVNADPRHPSNRRVETRLIR